MVWRKLREGMPEHTQSALGHGDPFFLERL